MKLLDDVVFPFLNDFALGPSVDALRAEVAGEARGRVLEIGAGTGLNFRHYRAGAEVTAIEPAKGMISRAARRALASEVHVRIELRGGRAGQLEFDSETFDAVVVSFVLCSVKDLDGSLRDVRRVLRKGGALHLVEHVVSPDPVVARFQRRILPAWKTLFGGCDPARDITRALEHTGFRTESVRKVELPLPFMVRPGILGTAVRS